MDSLPLNDKSLEVIVVDNGSQMNEAIVIAQRYTQVKAIRCECNLGFAGGNNVGVREATGKYLFFINNDTSFDDFNVHVLIDRLESSPSIAVVCPKIRFAWSPKPIQFAGYTPLTSITLRNRSIGYDEEDCGQYDVAHKTPYAHGAAMLVKREVIDKIGLLPECYFLYYEELDWSMMFTRAGYEIWYEPACTIYHKESRSTGIDSPVKTYYVTRNRFLFAMRNREGIQLFMTYAYLIAVVTPRDLFKHMFSNRIDLARATLRGIRDFIKLKHQSLNK